jgi:hypothetical protein
MRIFQKFKKNLIEFTPKKNFEKKIPKKLSQSDKNSPLKKSFLPGDYPSTTLGRVRKGQ